MLFQLDLARIIQVYVVQGTFGILFLLMAFLILRRDTKKMNVIFSLFYIFIAAGVLINFIYAPLTIESIVLVLYYMTIFCFFFSPIFLVILELILLKSEKVIDTYKQLIIVIIYSVILLGMIFIPEGVTINASTDWKPVYSLLFYVYIMIVVSVMAIVPGVYFAFQIYRQFEDELLKKKWGYFIIGITGLYILMYGTVTSNTLNNQLFRTIWAFISLVLLITVFLIYYGVGRQIQK